MLKVTEIKLSPKKKAIATLNFLYADVNEGLDYGVAESVVKEVYNGLGINLIPKGMRASELLRIYDNWRTN